mmetsp:Transcript_81845/g.226812  ORF Transcript_81845/g.226812 Transcript_81845/m.226812 type:complete len:208 (-) Transcript_81845:1627-2250(-)
MGALVPAPHALVLAAPRLLVQRPCHSPICSPSVAIIRLGADVLVPAAPFLPRCSPLRHWPVALVRLGTANFLVFAAPCPLLRRPTFQAVPGASIALIVVHAPQVLVGATPLLLAFGPACLCAPKFNRAVEIGTPEAFGLAAPLGLVGAPLAVPVGQVGVAIVVLHSAPHRPVGAAPLLLRMGPGTRVSHGAVVEVHVEAQGGCSRCC